MINRFKRLAALPESLPEGHKKPLWIVSMVSFLWATSSLMVFSVLPAFLTDELQLSHKNVGFLEGVALFLSFGAKVFSGVLSDGFRGRKPLIAAGSLLTVLGKTAFVVSTGVKGVFFARTMDRFSKGIRSAPTDALLADLGSGPDYGRVYGLRQSLYTAGAVFGAAVTMIVLHFFGPCYRFIFAAAVLPSCLALILLLQMRLKSDEQPGPARNSGRSGKPLHVSQLQRMPAAFWYLMAAVSLLMVARFSEVFINLRVKEVGLPVSLMPAVIILMDIIHATVALPFGRVSDRFSREGILIVGMLVQVVAALTMGAGNSISSALAAVAMVGIYMGVTQGVLRAMIAQVTPADLRGSAFAVFYLFSGISVLAGNTLAGVVSDSLGLSAVFWGGACFTMAAIIVLSLKPVLLPKLERIASGLKS